MVKGVTELLTEEPDIAWSNTIVPSLVIVVLVLLNLSSFSLGTCQAEVKFALRRLDVFKWNLVVEPGSEWIIVVGLCNIIGRVEITVRVGPDG